MMKSSHSSYANASNRSQKPAFALLAAALMLMQSPVFAREVQLKVNNLLPIRLKANEPGAAIAQDGQSVAYFANNVPGQLNRRTLQVRLAEPLLCADFSTAVSDDRLRLRLVQSNNDIQDFGTRGFAGLVNFNAGNDSGGVRYQHDPLNANLSFLKVSTDTLVCYDFSSDFLFSDGFETNNRNLTSNNAFSDSSGQRSALADLDLVTSIRTPDGSLLSSARPGTALNYVITVSNNGTISANNVQVRDYFPKRTNAANGNPNGAAFDNGSWVCTATGGASCGAASGSNYVFLSNASIPAFGSLRIAVNRTLSNSPNLPAGTPFSLQAAAFAAPSENEDITGNNAISIPMTAVTNSNPILSIASNPTRSRGECQSVFTNPCEFTINVSDDAPPESVTLTATSSDTKNLVLQAPVTISPTLRRVRYSLNPSFSGTINVAVRGTDASGGFSDVNVPVLVTDPPPTITDVADISRDEDNGATGNASALMVIGPIAVTIGGVGVDVNVAQFEALSLDTSIIPQSAVVVGGSGANRTVTITVPRHAYNALSASVGAPSNITLTVRNGSASASDNFGVRLIAVNDPPLVSVRPTTNFNTPNAGANQSIANWVISQSVGPANEVTPPAGSGVDPQLINFRTLQINNQSGPVIQETAQTPIFGIDGTTIQVRWVTGSVPTGAACLQANIEDSAGGVGVAAGLVSSNSGTTTCVSAAVVRKQISKQLK
jgi:uncharacterized repeat protein (TIGR01451 family)